MRFTSPGEEKEETGRTGDKTGGGGVEIEGWEGEEKETDKGYIKDDDTDEGWETEMGEEREEREG